MVCQACGIAIAEGVHFCPRCGAQIVATQPMAGQPVYANYPPPQMYRPVPRVQRNLQLLGVLWCAFGVFRLLGGMMAIIFVKMMWFRRFGDNWQFGHRGPFGPEWMAALLPVIMVAAVVASALALLTGYALLTRRPWGRTLAIIVSVLSLVKFPFGTALGVYTLWVLAPTASGMEYDAIADRS